MKLTKGNLQKLKAGTENKLEKVVCKYVIDRWNDYSDKKSIFTEVLQYGCQSGIVTSLIYYRDTVEFYNKHKTAINELLKRTMDECGIYDPKQIFGAKWDDTDPLVLDDYNKNLLAWFGFEETLRNVGYNFDSVCDYI